ncbi:transporter [Bacteroidota bacterium]|nr:transporter [Bacteroidota bacterium]
MWHKIAAGVLRFRLLLLIIVAAITIFMAYKAKDVELTYSFAKVIPVDNPKYIDYLHFKDKFGEDGNVLVLGVLPKNLFDYNFFKSWYQLADSLKHLDGVEDVLSICKSYNAIKDTATGKISLQPIFSHLPKSFPELDSLSRIFFSLPFYKGRLYEPETGATLMAVRINQKKLDSKDRIAIVNGIKQISENFSQRTGLEVNYSGLPMIRTVMATQVAAELNLFLLLAALVTGLVLLFLLRSFFAVVFSLLVVGVCVVWSVGTLVLFGFKITLLTGLIPPLVVVIGITNCVYLLNKYHIEYVRLGDKMQALQLVIEKIGLATLFTNLTAAIGFGVFYFTRSTVLKEFGLVAGLNIAGIFVVSVIIIPCVFSYLPVPRALQLSYLKQTLLNKILDTFTHWVNHYRKIIYTTTLVVVVFSIIGMMRLTSTGFIVDDIPHGDKLYTDLKFFEQHFKGVMPFEIMVEGKEKNALKKGNTLMKMNQLQDTLKTYSEFSSPLSILEAIKFINQANAQGDPSQYKMIKSSGGLSGVDRNVVTFTYLMKQVKDKSIITPFVDSTAQTGRISVNMADVGSSRMSELFKELQPKIYSVFDTSKYKVTMTGTSVIFLEGNHFIIAGLLQSLALAFLLIALCMGYLFRSVRMVFFSVLPNLVPLALTAGLMGYFNIPLKPSTVLIYSIAFGIAIDNAIRFLAKYQQELHRHNFDVTKTVGLAMHEAGISIIYTSIILFFGFIIFTASHFGGTFYLGLLTSITLIVAMFNNLLLLPSMLLTLKSWADRRSLSKKTPADKLAEAEQDIPAGKPS